jgi:preprotein translocase subunit SecD
MVTVFGALLAGVRWSDAAMAPGLALDLEGGTEIILHPSAESGADVTDSAITQAINIIRQRVDASGVAEAEITSQGTSNIVVALPGKPSQETLDLVRESAQMVFRPVLVVSDPGVTTDDTATDTPTATPTATEAPTATPTPTDEATSTNEANAVKPKAVDPTAEPTANPTDDATTDTTTDTATDTAPTDPSDLAWVTDDLTAEFDALDCTDPKNLTGGATSNGDPDVAVVTCQNDGSAKFILGPVEVTGDMISSASSGLRRTASGAISNEWITTLTFGDKGTSAFRDATSRLKDLESPRNQFAIVLDGLVVSAPSVDETIPSGQAEISGSFTRDSAATLAQQLSFGALPLTFEVQSEEQISATLGSEQLQRGLLAGLIGLILVALYSLVQYRALGVVTIASLIVAGAVAYLTITTLSWQQGYRLSLPGVAGLIVAIGITADSFIVYFERIKDELREGRTLASAVDQGWARAKRTILASDAVSFLAAVVLYFLAVGGVRGFAYTLGLTTLIDLAVVFMFTHPVMLLIARHRFFAEGHRFSGLDPSLLGAKSRYVGRGRVAIAAETAGGGALAVPTEPGTPSAGALSRAARPGAVADGGAADPGTARMTIAERKAAQRKAADDASTEGEDA